MSTSRRGFLKGLAGAGAGVAAVGAGCAPDIEPSPVLDVPAPEDGKVVLRVPRHVHGVSVDLTVQLEQLAFLVQTSGGD